MSRIWDFPLFEPWKQPAGVPCARWQVGSLLLIALLVGCGDSQDGQALAPNRRTGLPPWTKPAPAAALPTRPSSTQIVIESTKVQSLGGNKYHASVPYRFTNGRPRVGLVYAINIQFVGAPVYELKRFMAAEISQEGTLEWDFDLASAGNKQPREFSVEMMESFVRDGRTGFAGRSNWTTGKIEDEE
ncbi:MAG: hypothetical protein ACO1RA_06915 [Planctomycetaceae bacterium]